MWAFMKAEGSTKDADAEHVYVECLLQPEMGLVELTTPKVRETLKREPEFARIGCKQVSPVYLRRYL